MFFLQHAVSGKYETLVIMQRKEHIMKYVTLRLNRMMAKLVYRFTGVDFCYGKRKLSKMCSFEAPCRVSGSVETRTHVEIGAFSDVGGNFGEGRIARICIGRYCSIAAGCSLGLQQHPTNFVLTSARQYFANCCGWDFHAGSVSLSDVPQERPGPTVIGNDVWVGANAIVMGGIKVGDGAIVAAGAVVTKDVPPYAIVGGVPAKIIRYRFDDETIRKLQELKLWDYNLADFGEIPWNDVAQAIPLIRKSILKGDIKPYSPKKLKAEDFTVTSLLRRVFEWIKGGK